MKLRYILPALALTLAVSCQQEKIGGLSDIQVSESYVSLDVNGGSASLELTAASSWQVDETSVPEWLTVSPMSGSAGENIVLSFTAAATKATQNAEVRIVCGLQTQYVNVIQYAQKTDPVRMTVAEALALIKTVDKGDGQSYNLDGEYYVTGIVCNITEISPSYGNATYYLSDDGSFTDGNWLQVYRGYWYNGGNFTSGDEFSVGDELTICGQLMSYKGTPETVEKTAYVVSMVKSLIKVASIDPEDGAIPAEGGSVTVTLDNKGNGLYVEVPAEAKSWLSISSVNGSSVTFSAVANNAGPRNATLVFSTTDGTSEYTAQAEISQLGATGSKDLPFSVSEAISYVKTLGGKTPGDFWVKGIVSKIVDGGEFGSFGNGTFWISEDGVYNDDLDLDFEAYRVYWFDNQKWVEGNAQIAVGAEVLICGKLTVYGNTAETSQNEAYVYSVNGVTTDAEGIGTLADPFTVKGAVAAANAVGGANSSFNAYIKGIVSQIANNGQFGTEFGNGTFWISEDGVYNNDKSLDFEAYRVLWLGNRKWAAGDPEIAVGDEVVLCGAITLYNGTAETASGKAYVYSHNGKTE